jgi:uncharacterized protein YjdB
MAGTAYAATDINGHWAKQTIVKWLSRGLIKGYPDGTFGPDKTVNRAEFVTMVNEAFGLNDVSATSSFKDVQPKDWFYEQVSSAAKAGYTAGYPDNTFKPGNLITRAEAAVMVATAAKLAAGSQPADFTDFDSVPAWAKDSVNAVVAAGIIKGYPDGSFKPQGDITRAESVVLLDQAMSAGQTQQPSQPTGTTVAVTGVSLSQTSLSVRVSSSAQLTATVAPDNATNKSVTWSSSDTAIATVDQTGLVAGVKIGSATITATTADGSKTATCTVDIIPAHSGGGGGGGSSSGTTTIAVTGVSLNKNSAFVTVGNSITLTATIAPANATNQNVTWTTSDATIASITTNGLNCTVEGVKAGSATITATTVNGSKTATCNVTVNAAPPTTELASNLKATWDGLLITLLTGTLDSSVTKVEVYKNSLSSTIPIASYAGSQLSAPFSQHLAGLTANDALTIRAYAGTTTKDYSITVQNAPTTIISAAAISDITVTDGTAESALGLPTQVNVTESNGDTVAVNVTWSGGTPAYDNSTAGTYVFTGTLVMPNGVTNPNNVTAALNVKVVVLASNLTATFDGLLMTDLTGTLDSSVTKVEVYKGKTLVVTYTGNLLNPPFSQDMIGFTRNDTMTVTVYTGTLSKDYSVTVQ